MTYIPDPIELMNARIEAYSEQLLPDDKFECSCGVVAPTDHGFCMSPIGDGPLACVDCVEQAYPGFIKATEDA